jgi:hypothetical protein
MKKTTLGLMLPLMFAATSAYAANTLVVTASNAPANQLLVYDLAGKLVQTVPVQGKGGASGNSHGIASLEDMLAVVNAGSDTVAILQRKNENFQMKQLVPTAPKPLSVAFNADHLYVLSATKIESHRVHGNSVSMNPDGVVSLLLADGSAAQVGVLPTQLIITEKANIIETVDLLSDGSVSGTATKVQNIPANVDTPFGLIVHENNAYVTIAHADETALVRNGKVLTVTPSGTQHSPCWLTIVGPFVYASNSPSMTLSRYAVYGQKIVQDAAIAATLNGSPTDIDAADGTLAVIDGAGGMTHLSIFSVDQDGNLALQSSASIDGAANGVIVMPGNK